MSREAMKQALDALGYVMSHGAQVQIAKDILTEAIEQAEKQEPVAWPADMLERIDVAIQRITSGQGCMRVPPDKTDPDLVLADIRKLIKSFQPASKPWVGLTDEEVSDVIDNVLEGGGWLDVSRALEAAIKRKNT